MYALRERTFGAFEAMDATLLLAGAAVLAGVVAFSLPPRNRRMQTLRRFPSRVREAVEDLPETMRDGADGARVDRRYSRYRSRGHEQRRFARDPSLPILRMSARVDRSKRA